MFGSVRFRIDFTNGYYCMGQLAEILAALALIGITGTSQPHGSEGFREGPEFNFIVPRGLSFSQTAEVNFFPVHTE